jgi:hypothetical protein
MAEAPDGRLALGLVGRGAVILDVPPNWFQRSPKSPAQPEPWEAPGSFEGRFSDQAVVIRTCRSPTERGQLESQELALAGLKARLASAVLAGKPRVHLGEECAFDRRPDVGIYGPTPTAWRHQCWRSRARVLCGPSWEWPNATARPVARTVEVKACEPNKE